VRDLFALSTDYRDNDWQDRRQSQAAQEADAEDLKELEAMERSVKRKGE
jgi:hypothetical protein